MILAGAVLAATPGRPTAKAPEGAIVTINWDKSSVLFRVRAVRSF
jgi:hypothetical protein